ncbi:MAG: efflux system, outer rane lipoprotein NodT family [Rhodocyclales bacterium]|nr:efflux system, outer rane lipoprotein NodT family [Rhodocyclales bacterium]
MAPSPHAFPVVRTRHLSLLAILLLAACSVGPDYVRPAIDTSAAYKEAGPWKTAEPQVADSRQPWWEAYGDPTLNALVQDAERANQNIRFAEAQYRQARAISDAARAGLWPGLEGDAGAQRARTNNNGGVKEANTYSLGLAASWEPDLWGGVRRSIESGKASEQASADTLAGVHLSIQAALAQDYLQLRIVDQLHDLYADTIAAYTRSLKLVQAQHAAGTALLSDVALAESQLATAQAQAVDLDAQRSQLEHAIAILTGRAPADFSLPPATAAQPFTGQLPVSPVGVPSQLLERRPDIAAAERRVAVANANIGVARAAMFPTLILSARGGFSAGDLSRLFDTPSRIWSLGAALAQTLFDGGLHRARGAQAVAAYDAAVADYKQTVLSGFQQVEDNLSTLRVLDQESGLQARAVQSSQLAERLALSQYRAGTSSYLNVITTQVLSLSNQRTAVQLRGRQLAASVSLITATGGSWNAGGNATSVQKNSMQDSMQDSTQKPTL